MDNNNWKKLIERKYIEIKQDDVSLILYPVGFNGIKHLKNAYQARLQYLQDNFIYPTANTRYDDLQKLWQKYRIDYEHYLPLIQDIQPSLPSIQEHQQRATDLSPVVANSSSVTSASSSLSTNTFQELSQSFKQKAAAKAEEIQILLDQAYSNYENNQLQPAQVLCNQVLEIDPHHSECKYLLGLIYTKSAFFQKDFYQRRQLYQEAVTYLNKVINNPGEKLFESYQTLGFIYYQLDEWNKSVKSYQECFKSKDAEKIEDWEEHLETFVKSLNLINNKHEALNVAIQFCHRLTTVLPYGKNAYPYYFMAVLQEIKGDFNAAWNSIQTAIKIYNSSYFPGVKYESVQKAKQKYQEIQNKLNYGGYY